MIKFACKKIKKEELIRCSFGLTKTEYNILLFLLKNKKNWKTHDIAEKMELDRTTIQKGIKKLSEKDLVVKKQRNLKKGGYIFLYEIKNKYYIKNKMKEIVASWYKEVLREIDDI